MGFFKPNIQKMRTRQDVEGLIKVLKHKDEWVRGEAAESLGVIGDARAVDPLIQALKDKDDYVRRQSAESLGVLGDTQYLERLLRDRNERVRFNAVESLVTVGGLEAVPALIRALKDTRKETYEAAAWGIQVPLMDSAKKIGRDRLREALIPAVEYLIDIVEKAKILKGARSYDRYVVWAIGTLGAIGDPSAIPVLENLLAKLKGKIAAEGAVREYVDTGIAAGYISSSDDINHIESAIKEIRRKRRKRRKSATDHA